MTHQRFYSVLSYTYYSCEYDVNSHSNIYTSAIKKNTVLPVIVGFADVPVISETIVDTGCDVVDGSADTVDELISTSTAFVKMYTSPFVCALELLQRYLRPEFC